MRPISKVFFFSLVVVLISFLSALAGQNHSQFHIKRHKVENRHIIGRSGLDKYPDPWSKHPFHKPGGTPLLPMKGSWTSRGEQKAIEAIIDDFLVNDDTTGGCWQYSAAIAQDLSGNFVITWSDARNGHYDIYAQRYSFSGTPLDTNFKVNDDSGTADQEQPAIAMDASGSFVITWTDHRDDTSYAYFDHQVHIYAQIYSASAAPLGANFRANDYTGAGWHLHGSPSITMDGFGNFIIAWEYASQSDLGIYAQRYNCSGVPMGDNFKVNEGGLVNADGPAVAADERGSFVITWSDDRNGINNYDIYAQRCDSCGNLVGVNFKVNDDMGVSDQWSPDIDMDSSGCFVITWRDFRSDGGSDIYFQRYDSSGSPLGTNSKVNEDTGTTYHSQAAIAVDRSGDFVIAWENDSADHEDIYAQRYDFSGSALGTNFKVNNDTSTADDLAPDIAINGSGDFVVSWTSGHTYGNHDIYAQRYDAAATPLSTNFTVNDDIGTAEQYDIAVAMNAEGNSIITWEDGRNGRGDIYAQRYSLPGIPLGNNFRVNDDIGNSDQWYPAVATNSSGSFVIAWQDFRYGEGSIYSRDGDIFAQRYDSYGSPLDANFMVNDDVINAKQGLPAVSMDDTGRFVITWSEENRHGGGDIYAQTLLSDGTLYGYNFKVNADVEVAEWEWISPAIAMNNSGSFVITWNAYCNGHTDIYAQRFSFSGLLGNNFRVNDDTGTVFSDIEQYSPAIAIDGFGNFVITWLDERFSTWYYSLDIYAQRYDSSGTPLGGNFKVNDDAGFTIHWPWYPPAIAMDGSGSFVITWTDFRNGNADIYAQRYNTSGDPVGDNCLVTNLEYASLVQKNPAVACNNSDIYFAWLDSRRAKGMDVYAKVVGWDGSEVEEEQEIHLPHSVELSQNYPNPFNPVTRIQYTVGSEQTPIHTTLKVYNILGQLVRTLVDEEMMPGNYQVNWDGKDSSGKEVASGIYLYKLRTKDYTATRKMVLLR